MIRKLIRIGNSVGVTLDREMLRALNMDGSTWVWVELDKSKKKIIIRKRDENEW